MPFQDGSLREAIAEALKSRNAELKKRHSLLLTLQCSVTELLILETIPRGSLCKLLHVGFLGGLGGSSPPRLGVSALPVSFPLQQRHAPCLDS
jgi:hypothetical protein